jgi:hypothetical protein
VKTRKVKVSRETYGLIKEMQKRMIKFDRGDPTIEITPELVIIRCLCNPAYLIQVCPELSEAEQFRSEISSLAVDIAKLKARLPAKKRKK